MKARWKCLVEIAAAMVFIWAGAYQMSSILSGHGPWWYWGGIAPLLYGFHVAQSNWREL